jgi:hypothetical protein
MIRSRAIAYVTSIVLIAATPTAAAVTAKGPSLDENPRAAWLERYQESRQGSEQTERVTQVLKVGGDAILDVSNMSGDISVTTVKGNEIRIEATKRVRHRDANEAKRLLALLRVDITQAGSRVQVRTVYPRTTGRGFSGGIEYVITVPADAGVALKTMSGDVTVNGVRGEVRAESMSGDVSVTATPNVAVAKTVSGNVTARDIGAQTLTLGTISGSVIASALKVKSLDAGTVSGDVHLSNSQIERLQAKSMSGNIEFDGTLTRGGHYALTAHSGNVRIILANAKGFELDASTFSGSLRTDFPVTLRTTDQDQNGRRRGSPNRSMRGTFGDGSAMLEVRSFSGTVVITRK